MKCVEGMLLWVPLKIYYGLKKALWCFFFHILCIKSELKNLLFKRYQEEE
jgi:hypothetical protein